MRTKKIHNLELSIHEKAQLMRYKTHLSFDDCMLICMLEEINKKK